MRLDDRQARRALRRKPRYLANLVLMVWFYAVDFGGSATTAERRQADVPSSGRAG